MSITLTAQKRDLLGKKVRQLRKNGLIPAELFGPKTKNQHLSVPEKEFSRAFKEAGTNTVVDIAIEGEKEPVSVFIYDVQTDTITKRPLHIDLYQVRKDVKSHATVPLVFIGTAPIEKKDCIVVHVVDELVVEAFPQDMPHEITVDVSLLQNEGDVITLKDLKLPKHIDIDAEPDLVIVTTEAKRAEEKAEAPATETEATATAETAKETSAEEDESGD